MKNQPVRYSISPSNPEAHLFEVRCTVDNPDLAGQKFSLPTWIPGSYLIREFARHVVRIRAQSGRKLLRMVKLDKNSWQVEPVDGPVTVTMEVYAWDLSVRGARLDTTHAFFNGPSVFLKVDEREDEPVEVENRMGSDLAIRQSLLALLHCKTPVSALRNITAMNQFAILYPDRFARAHA